MRVARSDSVDDQQEELCLSVPLIRAGVSCWPLLALTACGSRDSGGGNNSGGTTTKTAKIGVIALLSGDLSALGKGIQHSVGSRSSRPTTATRSRAGSSRSTRSTTRPGRRG